MNPLTRTQIAARISTDPLLLDPGSVEFVRHLLRADTEMAISQFDPGMSGGSAPYQMLAGGIAVVPVHGYLAHRVGFHIPGYMTGYDYITALVDHAANDSKVKGVMLDVNSGGGEVAGAFDAAGAISKLAANKPVWAIVDNTAYSAAYLLSSAANKVTLPQAGGAGSIGVVTMHVDKSKLLEDNGFKVTMLYAGKSKVDGNPYEPLSDGARSRIENKLQASYNLFVDTVSSNRGMDSADVKATEAATFQGADAQTAGLVDAVMSPKEALAAFQAELAVRPSKRGNAMSIENEQAAPATLNAADTEKNERARISGIMKCEESEGRRELAEHLAFNTDMSVEAAKAILGAAPKKEAAPAASASPFDAAMTATGNPDVGASAESNVPEVSDADRIVAAYSKATGQKINK